MNFYAKHEQLGYKKCETNDMRPQLYYQPLMIKKLLNKFFYLNELATILSCKIVCIFGWV